MKLRAMATAVALLISLIQAFSQPSMEDICGNRFMTRTYWDVMTVRNRMDPEGNIQDRDTNYTVTYEIYSLDSNALLMENSIELEYNIGETVEILAEIDLSPSRSQFIRIPGDETAHPEQVSIVNPKDVKLLIIDGYVLYQQGSQPYERINIVAPYYEYDNGGVIGSQPIRSLIIQSHPYIDNDGALSIIRISLMEAHDGFKSGSISRWYVGSDEFTSTNHQVTFISLTGQQFVRVNKT